MYIKELIVDGFKSYATRTVINGWDIEFNAITGLNGSGKSNILDAICFVLGISNLSQVRVNNLQELVYKSGQANITKASVTIVFDNTDMKRSPVGYEQCEEITVTRQIVIGGRNKYMINGHTAQLNRVQNLFHSVGLNVNNPHFLIMQGRITKVLNMKPQEILAMIEEAAGTRMYELKKLSALKLIQKKQTKVDEINKILAEEITPTLERLRKEKASFLQWSDSNTKIERLSRFCIAYDFYMCTQKGQEQKDTFSQLNNDKEISESKIHSLHEEIKEYEEEIEQLQKTKKRYGDSALESQTGEQSKTLVQKNSRWQNLKDSIKTEQQTLSELIQQKEQISNSLSESQNQHSKLQSKVDNLTENNDDCQNHLASLISSQVGIGLSVNNQNTGSLPQQLIECEKNISVASSNVSTKNEKIDYLTKEIQKINKEMKEIFPEYKNMKTQQDKYEEKMAKIKNEISTISKNITSISQLLKKRETLSSNLNSHQEELNKYNNEMAVYNFDYSPPKNFDVSKVKGLVASLIQVPDKKMHTPLEVCGGGKLWNIVVDNAQTGKLLLEKGQIRRRVTIIPLDQIIYHPISKKTYELAQQKVGPRDCKIALELIGYDDALEKALHFVFGHSIVCRTSEQARLLAYDPNIKVRTVTYSGDLFDPSGIITGGFRPTGGKLLEKITYITELKKKINKEKEALSKLDQEISSMQKISDRKKSLEEELDDLIHNHSLIISQIELSTYSTLEKQSTQLSIEHEELQKSLVTINKQLNKYIFNKKELQTMITDLETSKNQKEVFEKRISEAKIQTEKSHKSLNEVKNQYDQLNIEINQYENELKTCSANIQQCQESIILLEKEGIEAQNGVEEARKQYDELNSKFNEEKTETKVIEKKIQTNKKAKESSRKELTNEQLKLKSIDHSLQRFIREEKEMKKKEEELLHDHPWIQEEQHLFGRPNSDYDFSQSATIKKQKSLIEKLKKEQEKLSKNVNKKVMGMFDKTEQDYQDLMKKRNIIENDKKKIEDVIEQLDIKKQETLLETWKKVNTDFGDIFSTLLPGSTAKLEPYNPKVLEEGLEIHCRFGEVWKESLVELSGGQRSLLALSLILALLRFKPAPMYILDEIDAALDLSHTQNIGYIVKNYFSQSQFIVVSLKEGMFQNANVVFRTKFIDGVSTVNRIDNKEKNNITNASRSTKRSKK